MKNTALRLDRLTRQTTVQSKSFDEIASVSKTAGDMVSCIPAIPPIVPDPSKYHLSSPFGYRSDPFTTESKMHTGVDFAMDIGNPIYATGDGVVETVDFDFFGYGNCQITQSWIGLSVIGSGGMYGSSAVISLNTGAPG